MSEYQRMIFVPYQNDYEGGPQSPAFTNRKACEQWCAAANANSGWDEYTVEEWPLLDAMPVKAPWYRRSAHVHADGFVCVAEPSVQEMWDHLDPAAGNWPPTQNGTWVWVTVAGRTEAEADAAYEGALAQAHAMALGLADRRIVACSTECRHPAVTGFKWGPRSDVSPC